MCCQVKKLFIPCLFLFPKVMLKYDFNSPVIIPWPYFALLRIIIIKKSFYCAVRNVCSQTSFILAMKTLRHFTFVLLTVNTLCWPSSYNVFKLFHSLLTYAFYLSSMTFASVCVLFLELPTQPPKTFSHAVYRGPNFWFCLLHNWLFSWLHWFNSNINNTCLF